ncbi:MAG: O-antigen ligase family protein [Bacteroidia bacterium]
MNGLSGIMGMGPKSDWLSMGFACLVISAFFPEFISSYTIMLFVVLSIVQFRKTGFRWPAHGWVYGLALLFLWQLVGMGYSSNPEQGWPLLGMSLLMALIPWLLHSQQLQAERLVQSGLRWLWGSTLLASFYLTGLGLVKIISIGEHYWYYSGFYLYYTGLAEHLMHPTYLSCLVSMAFMGAVYLRWKGQLRSNRVFYLCQAWLLLFLVMLSARMTILAFVLSSALLLLYLARTHPHRKKLYRLLLLMPLVLLLLFLALPATVQERYTSLLNAEYDIGAPEQHDFNGLTIRLAEWKGVGEAMQGHWWLGHGTGGGKQALLAAYERIGFGLGVALGYNAHNQLLETALGNGLPGSMLLLLVFVLAFRKAWLNNNWLAMWLLVFIFISMQSESLLIRNRGALFFAMYTGLLLLLPRASLPGKAG